MHLTNEMKRQRKHKVDETYIQVPTSMESIVSSLAACAKIFVYDFVILCIRFTVTSTCIKSRVTGLAGMP